jgi:hypothetical protein
MPETPLVRELILHSGALGARLFRNNVGRWRDATGHWVTYGLCVGSSDVIGWTSVTVTPEMVGRTLAVFTAFECKVGRRVTTTEQGAFLAAVKAQGGIAAVVRRLEDADAAVRTL